MANQRVVNARDQEDKPRRRADFDSRGQPKLEVEVERDVFKRADLDTERLRKLGVGAGGQNELSLADTARIAKKSFEPYEGSGAGRVKQAPKRSRLDSMRALSEEIKRRRAMGLDPVMPPRDSGSKK